MEIEEQWPNCLLVDDLEENLVALKALLEGEKMNIMTARSGESALELLLKYDFAFAMVDVQMPGMDGFELAEIARSTERTKSIPIIFVTAAGTDVQRVFRGYEAGAVDFLHKPLYPQIVLGKARVFLEMFKQKKQLEQKIAALSLTESSLQMALRSRDEFLSICSHELNTPLTSLKLLIQMTERSRKQLGDDKAMTVAHMIKFFENVTQCVNRLIHLVSEMLDLSRISSGTLLLNKEELSLKNVICKVLESLESYMQTAKCPVQLSVEQDVTGYWDAFRLEQVILNLLTNAAKYAPDTPIEVSVKTDGHHAILSIKDHGPGITPEDQARIFNKFERAIPYTSISGLGLGLFIAREIIELHDGIIEVESRPREGATFIVRLPVGKEVVSSP